MSSADSKPNSATPLPTSINFLTAGLGGILGWIIVHPFNTAAVRMSLEQGVGSRGQSFFSFMGKTIKEKGAMSLYNGLSAGILRQIFYATSRFGLFEVFRDEMAKYRETDIWSRLISGCASGAMAAFISCPAEVTLVRLSNDATLPPEKRRNYTGVTNAFSRIIKEEGPKAFFSGSAPFVNRAMLVGVVQVGTFDQFKATYKGMGITSQFQNTFCASMSAGLLYSIVTMPFETAKNAMAFQKPDPVTGKNQYRGVVQSIQLLAQQRGVPGLWTGFLPYYLRCGGHTVSMFVFVEYMRKIYQGIN